MALALAVVAVTVGCSSPEARYDADLDPCDLISEPQVQDLLGVDAGLGPGAFEEGLFDDLSLNSYCTWEYEDEDTESEPDDTARPYYREFVIDLLVYPAESGGNERAHAWLSDTRKRRDDVKPIRHLGEQALSWWEPDRAASYIAFQRANAVVTVHLRGEDCCRAEHPLRFDLTEKELHAVLMNVARHIDSDLKSRN